MTTFKISIDEKLYKNDLIKLKLFLLENEIGYEELPEPDKIIELSIVVDCKNGFSVTNTTELNHNQ